MMRLIKHVLPLSSIQCVVVASFVVHVADVASNTHKLCSQIVSDCGCSLDCFANLQVLCLLLLTVLLLLLDVCLTLPDLLCNSAHICCLIIDLLEDFICSCVLCIDLVREVV